MRLVTFGGLTLAGSDFRRAKALALLAYLSLEGPRERRHLADLFWPGNDNALGNLSMTLSRLNKALPDILGTEGSFVRSNLSADFKNLEQAFASKDWEGVLALYRGPFLDGVTLRNAGTELEEWLYDKRERFANLAREALLQKAEHRAGLGDFEKAANLAAEGYHLRYAPEPDAADLERIYVLLQTESHPNTQDVRKEATGYGLDLKQTPAEARARLLEATQQTSFVNFPSFPTFFVGREKEMGRTKQLLLTPEVRLVTLLSQGGMGKTRLAVEVGRTLADDFGDGSCFVSFVSTPTPDQLPFTLGAALNYSFSGSESAESQLLRFLKDKTMLLVLDNLEHLLSGVTFVSDLLAAAPDVKILATSRESLNVRAEHILELRGLAFTSETPYPNEPADAAKLFVQAARNRQPDFVLDEKTTPQVDKLCRLVEGMPLALELAASWSRTLSLGAIISELEKGIDLLQASVRDLPDRHRSIRAVFDYSWQLLSDDEQGVMRKLAVFRGGFDREAAETVAGATLPTLASLIDKSFLHRTDHERYRRHPLVIQYSQDRLAEHPEEKAQTEEAHARYFLEHIRVYAPKMRSLERKASWETLEPDFENIKKAWAVQKNEIEVLRDYAEALCEVFSNRMQEATEMLHEAVVSLDEDDPHHHRVLASLYINQANNLYWVGTVEERLRTAKKGLMIARSTNDKRLTARALMLSTQYTEPTDNGISPYAEGLEVAKQHGLAKDVSDFLFHQLIYERNHGDFPTVVRHFEDALKTVEELGDFLSLLSIKVIFASYLVYNDRLDRGYRLLQECLSLNRQLSIVMMYNMIYAELGYAAFRRKSYQEAASHFADASETAERTGQQHCRIKSLGYLARIAITRGDRKVALDCLKKIDLNFHTSVVLEAMIGFASYQAKFASPSKAVALLQFIHANPWTELRDREQAKELLDSLEGQLPERVFEEAIEEGRGLEFEEVIRQSLEMLSDYKHA